MNRPSLRRWTMAWMALLLPLASLPAQQKKAALSYRIAGIVLNARDSSPVRHCSLSARLVSAGRGLPRDPVLADTDETGHFAMVVPAPGDWELTASAHNIRSQPLDAHDGYFTGIILTPQSPSYEVVFRAVPDAVLTGVVTDEAGEAVRNAQVNLFAVDPAARLTGGTGLQQRNSTQTDDRGHYEMAGLDARDYMVEVQARPWYASSSNAPNRSQAAAASPDPSLDVVYPNTWYPGVTDASAAGVLTARQGDVLQADFRLQPVAAAHLLIPSTGAQGPVPGRLVGNGDVLLQRNPMISLVLPNGRLQQVFGQFNRNASGDLDISGLSPGTYQVTMPGAGPDSPGQTSIVRIQSGGSSTALSAATPDSTVTIKVDKGASTGESQVALVDNVTGQVFSASERGMGGRMPGPPGRDAPQPPRGATLRSRPGGQGPGRRERPSGDSEEFTIQVPPGRYDVALRGTVSAFITGVEAKGASVTGRSVTIPEGTVRLTVHLASGFATVSGTALAAGKPIAGAMVLLVPATFGDPASLTVARRDQTDSDGSFHLDSVIPGQYILLAIDRGWSVRWTDPATLRHYLMQGTPLDLRSSQTVNPRLTAIAP